MEARRVGVNRKFNLETGEIKSKSFDTCMNDLACIAVEEGDSRLCKENLL